MPCFYYALDWGKMVERSSHLAGRYLAIMLIVLTLVLNFFFTVGVQHLNGSCNRGAIFHNFIMPYFIMVCRGCWLRSPVPLCPWCSSRVAGNWSSIGRLIFL